MERERINGVALGVDYLSQPFYRILVLAMRGMQAQAESFVPIWGNSLNDNEEHEDDEDAMHDD